MAKRRAGHLYRRASGIYVVRICVPKRLQAAVGRGEIHISTGVRDPTYAKIVALRSLLQWNQRLLELDGMDILKVVEGSPLLAGEGLISILDASQMFGLDTKTLLIEATNSKADLLCIGEGWQGVEIPDIKDIERDDDGSFILNDVDAQGQPTLTIGNLIFFDTSMAVKSFIEFGEHLAQVLFRDSRRRRAVFFEPGINVGLANLYLFKKDVEIIRLRFFSGITPQMIETANSLRQKEASLSVPTIGTGHKYGNLHVSELLSKFLIAKKTDWKSDHYTRMAGDCGIFVELMKDPMLFEIDRPKMGEYRELLQALPRDLRSARRRFGMSSSFDLIEEAERLGEERMLIETANSYIRKLSEMFNWAVKEEFLPRNPAEGIGKNIKKSKRDQDDRDIFEDADLAKIFGAEWFIAGEGKKTKRGKFRNYQPHYYWLPILGLFSGGRLNELAQLYLNDVVQDSDSCYLDFNLSGSDKIDVDPKQEHSLDNDKSLKTINSMRVVALHDQVIALGFLEYVEALRKQGHTRLFPELRFDKVKGYGKSAGSWFNERFLGNQLHIPRDSTKTFHSLRHTFITGLYDAEVPEVTVAQLAGHERGESMSAQRYRKDQSALKLKPYISRLEFNLPTIKPFNVASGILAVKDALDRKSRHPLAKV
jgi:integrase